MLQYRLIFGPMMVAMLVGLIFLDLWLEPISLEGTWLASWAGREQLPPGFLVLIVLLILIALAARELHVIFKANSIEADTSVLTIGAMGACAIAYWVSPTNTGEGLIMMSTWMSLVFVFGLFKHSQYHRIEGAVAAAAGTVFAFVYLGLLFSFLIWMRQAHGVWVAAGALMTAKACDIGAYTTGRIIGRHKFVPWLSPGKTWEGVVGGLVFAVLAAMGLAAWARACQIAQIPTDYALVMGLCIGVAGIFGDLAASLLKRDAGVKDAGDSVPGFGGVIDVIDSALFTAPVAYWLLELGPVK